MASLGDVEEEEALLDTEPELNEEEEEVLLDVEPELDEEEEELLEAESEEEQLEAEPEEVVVKPAMLVTIVVQDTKRRALSRTMRRTDKLQDLMDYYYDVLSPAVSYGEGRFLFDGTRVKGNQTPEDYDMVSGDKIDFFPDLTGGGRCRAGRIDAC